MTEPRLRPVVGFVAIAIILAAATVVDAQTIKSAPTDLRPAACTEDMECWNCATMGNHACGPGSTWTMTDPEIGTALTCVLTDYQVICLEED